MPVVLYMRVITWSASAARGDGIAHIRGQHLLTAENLLLESLLEEGNK